MATLTTQAVTHAGAAFTYAAASGGGDKAATGPGYALLVKNGDSGAHVVTLVTPGTVDGNAIADKTLSVAAGATGIVSLAGPYRDSSDGLCHITYDGVTSVTVACIQVP